MASTSETGNAKKVANFQDLIAFVIVKKQPTNLVKTV